MYTSRSRRDLVGLAVGDVQSHRGGRPRLRGVEVLERERDGRPGGLPAGRPEVEQRADLRGARRRRGRRPLSLPQPGLMAHVEEQVQEPRGHPHDGAISAGYHP